MTAGGEPAAPQLLSVVLIEPLLLNEWLQERETLEEAEALLKKLGFKGTIFTAPAQQEGEEDEQGGGGEQQAGGPES